MKYRGLRFIFGTSLGAIVLMPLVACGPVYTKRFASINNPPPVSDATLELSAFVVPKEASSAKPRLIADLPERAQAAAIQAVSQGSALSAKQVAALLSQSIDPPKGSQDKVDAARFPVRLAVIIDYTGSGVSRAADRLAKLNTQFRLGSAGGADHPASPRFTSWSKLVNDHVEVDLGDVTFKQTASSEIAVNPVTDKVSLGSQFGAEITEVVRLRDQILPLYGVLNGRNAKLVQMGSLGRDLIGVQTIDLTVGFEEVETRRLATSFAPSKDGKPANLSTALVTFPANCAAVFAQVEADGILRKVKSGEKTVIESDDTITFENLYSLEKYVKIIDSEKLKRDVWIIHGRDSNALGISLKGQETRNGLEFSSFETAERFLVWLRAQSEPPSSIGDTTMSYSADGEFVSRPSNWDAFRAGLMVKAELVNAADNDAGQDEDPCDLP